MNPLFLPSRKFIRQSLLWLLILSILLFWVFPFHSQPTTLPHDNDTETTSSTFSNSTQDNISNNPTEAADYDLSREKAASTNLGPKISDLLQPVNIVLTIIFVIIGTLLLSTGYIIDYNNEELIGYISTASRLAGLDISLSSFGRSWKFNEHAKMSIAFYRLHNLHFVAKAVFHLPYKEKYQIYGFTKKGDFIIATCNFDQLQVTLQNIATYLREDKSYSSSN